MIKRIRLSVLFFIGSAIFSSAHLTAADDIKKIKSNPEQNKSVLSRADSKKAAEAYNRKAIALFEAGRYAEAQELWEKAIDVIHYPGLHEIVSFEEPEEPVEKTELPAPAEPIFEEVPEVDPLAGKYQEGLSLLERKEYDSARKVFEEIKAADPTYRNAQKYLGVIEELTRESKVPVVKETTKAVVIEEKTAEEESVVEEDVDEPIVKEPLVTKIIDEQPQEEPYDLEREQQVWQEAVAAAEEKLRAEIAAKAEPVYARAVQQYKSKQFTDAKNSFLEVKTLAPGYKLTDKYLAGIDEDILYEAQQREEEQRLAEERARRQDEMEFKKAIAAKEEAFRKELNAKTEQIYQQAINDFKNRRFEESEDNFRKVQGIEADYKLTSKYLERIAGARQEQARQQKEEELRRQTLTQEKEQEELKKTVAESERLREQKLQEEAEAVYQKARSYYSQGDLDKAKFNFDEVEKIRPGYRSSAKYLVQIDEDIKRAEQLEKERVRQEEIVIAPREKQDSQKAAELPLPAPRKRVEAQRYYDQAKDFYKKREFRKAKELFLKVHELVKNYQATDKFLARIDTDIRNEENYQVQSRKREVERQAREKEILDKKQAAKAAAAASRQQIRYQKALKAQQEQEEAARQKALEQEKAIPPPIPVAEEVKKEEDKKVEGDKNLDGFLSPEHRQAQQYYDEALSLYKKRKFSEAKEAFEKVNAVIRGYESTNEYLRRIEEQQNRQQAMQQWEQQRQARKELSQEKARQKRELRDARRQAREQLALEKKQAAQAAAEARRQEAEAQKVVPASATELEAGKYYEQGKYLYKKREFQKAKELFEKANARSEGYQETAKYLARIDAQLSAQEQQRQEREQRAAQRQQRQQQAAAKAQAAKEAELLRKQAAAQEKQAAQEALALKNQADQEAAAERRKDLIDIKDTFVLIKDKRAQAENKKVEAIYREAQSDFQNQLYVLAQERFREVQRISPGYKSTEDYLARIEAQMVSRAGKPHDLPQKYHAAPATSLQEYQVIPASSPVSPAQQAAMNEPLITSKTVMDEKIIADYKTAVSLFKSKQYLKAREKFLEVAQQQADYMSTQGYIQKIEEQLAAEEELRLAQQRNALVAAMRQEKAQKQATPAAVAPEAPIAVAAAPVPVLVPDDRNSALERARLKAEEFFQEGIRLYETKQYTLAQKKFQEADSLIPDYKLTQKYLALVDRALKEEQKIAERARLKQEREQARRTARETALRKAEERRAAVAAKTAEKERGVVLKEEEKRHQRLFAQAEEKYRQALSSYKSNDFIRAKKQFVEVETLWPDFKDTGRYLSRIDSDIAAQKEEPKVRETLAPIIEVKGEKQVSEDERRRLKADELWPQAIALYKSKDLAAARDKFEEINLLIPGYKSSDNYIAKIDGGFARQQQMEQRAQQKEQALIARQQQREAKIREREQTLAAQEQERAKRKEQDLLARQRKQEEIKQKEQAPSAFEQAQVNAPAIEARPASEIKALKQTIALMQQEVVTAGQQRQWDLAKRKLAELEIFLSQQDWNGLDKQRYMNRTAQLHADIENQRISSEVLQYLAAEIVVTPTPDPVEKVKAAKALEAQRRKLAKDEKIKQKNELKNLKATIARMEKEATTARKQGQWAAAEQKLINLENLLSQKDIAGLDKNRQLSRIAKLRGTINKEKVAAVIPKPAEVSELLVKEKNVPASVPAPELSPLVEAAEPGLQEQPSSQTVVTSAVVVKPDEPGPEMTAKTVDDDKALKDEYQAAQARQAEKQKEQKLIRELKNILEQMYRDSQRAFKNGNSEFAEQKLTAIENQMQNKHLDNAYKKKTVARVNKLRKSIETRKIKSEQERIKTAKQTEKRAPAPVKVSQGNAAVAVSTASQPGPIDDIRQIQNQRAKIQKERKAVLGVLQTKLDQLYTQAVNFYKNGNYAQARDLFTQITAVDPLFKETRNYLANISDKLSYPAPPVRVLPRRQAVTEALDNLEVAR